MILRTAELFGGNQVLSEVAEFVHDGIHYLAGRIQRRSRIDSQTARSRTCSARNTPRTPSPAFRECSGIGASSSRRPAPCSTRSRRSDPGAEADRPGRPCKGASAPATTCSEHQAGMRRRLAIRRYGSVHLQVFEMITRQVHDLRVPQITGRGDQDVRRRIHRL